MPNPPIDAATALHPRAADESGQLHGAAFLQGGGAMGEYIRAFDWAATPLGPPQQWPLPLRTSVRILLTTGHPVFIFWGPELRCFYNDAYSKSIGPEKHPSILGLPGRDAWPEIWHIIGPQIDYVMTGKGSTWDENALVPIIRYGKQEDVYWTYSYSPIDEPASPYGVGGVLVLCTETTEQVLAAERLKAAEGRLRIACEAADLGIHDMDLGTGTISWDTRIRGLWGIDLADQVTYADVFLGGLHPDDRSAAEAQLVRATDPAGDGHYLAEYRVINRIDSIMRWVQATGRVTFDGDTPRRLVGTMQDITERKLADARRIEFLATLGHELRNPLGPISNSLELLRRGEYVSESSRRALDVIARQLRHMVRLLEDLLDVVRISTGRIDLRRETIALDDVIQMAVEAATPHVERGRHDVSLRGSGEPVFVHADPVRLAQVFSNLLINACKYSNSGSPITLAIDPVHGGTVTVRVIDQGIGIRQEDLARVFEMFSQSGPSLERSEGGLGIGLSLARGLVELHGGSIEVASEGLHLGSQFLVRLPVRGGPSGVTRLHGAEHATAPVDGIQVLVVDDNIDAATTLATLLRSQGATVAVARDGIEALEMAESVRPQVILLDIGLPGLNGFEVCRALRLRPWAATVRIVALTGWGQERDRSQSRDAGFDAHLVKPVDYDTLMRTITEV